MQNIIHLSEAAAIGLHSMAVITLSNKSMNVHEIAEKIGSSKHHVAKIMQRLNKKGFVSSTRGPKGGFVLNKPTNEISLLDIYESIESKIEIASCPANKEVCPFGKCLIGDITNKLKQELIDFLSSKKLSDYVNK